MPSDAKSLPDNAKHLLVIDDDSRIRTLLHRYLTNNGFRVTTAQNAQEARKTISGLTFDMLILDVMMPGESGMELAADLCKSNPVPILMLTARAEAESRIQGLEIGVADYLSKPFEPRELLLRIRNILKRNDNQPQSPIDEVTFGPFCFKLERQELLCGADVIRLTDRERNCSACLPPNREQPLPAWHLPEKTELANAPLMCKSTACAARLSPIPPTRSICRPSEALAIVY